MDELSEWMLTFKDKLDDKTSSKVFQTLKANGFTSRLQLKLLTKDQVDVLFQNEISLGAKCLVVYNLQVLNESSPLQPISRRRASDKNDNRDNKPLARKNVLPALQTQCEVLKEKMEIQRQECKELQMNIDSMDIHVKELPAMGNSRTICGNCHHKGHRNQPTNPCRLPKCTDYTYCGNKEKHPEYFQKLNAMKLELNKRTTALKEMENQVSSVENFSSKSEYQFIKNLTPLMYAIDSSYKLNKAKLMRDVRILRTATDGRIPEVTSNDSEQLRILLNKSKKDIKVRAGVQFTSDDEMDENNFDREPERINKTKTNSSSSSSDDNTDRGKRKKRSKKSKKKKQKKRRRSSSSSGSSDVDYSRHHYHAKNVFAQHHGHGYTHGSSKTSISDHLPFMFNSTYPSQLANTPGMPSLLYPYSNPYNNLYGNIPMFPTCSTAGMPVKQMPSSETITTRSREDSVATVPSTEQQEETGKCQWANFETLADLASHQSNHEQQ